MSLLVYDAEIPFFIIEEHEGRLSVYYLQYLVNHFGFGTTEICIW